ncbi:hypothetical protein [Bacillus sp. B-jedd]|uniref:hypothetical protein n=1 Tax=Bacillus sp. B-jedd TaxID=1476857 RepID=UPI0005156F71|nr:hypothetical protein [Bacillus sp. B-jedd]CEG25587.1 hypothetical protein BN1002_00401 [Bacillus sp. B-jedd]
MSGQEEFRELESALKGLPQKQLKQASFDRIHQSIIEEADRLDAKDRWMRVMKRSLAGVTGAAALFVVILVGYLVVNQGSFDQSESAKMSEDKASGGDQDTGDRKMENFSNGDLNGELTVEALKSKDGTNDWTGRRINDASEIERIRGIFGGAEWEETTAKMDRAEADFILNGKYSISVLPEDNSLEIFVEGENKYTKLPKEESEILYKILAGKKPGE